MCLDSFDWFDERREYRGSLENIRFGGTGGGDKIALVFL